MLEPLASSVLTSIFSVRPPVVTTYSSRFALRTMTRALSADFFTPHPRRAKGKERASESEDCSACGSSCGGAGSPSGARTPAVRPAVPGRHRIRRLSTQRPFADAPRGRISDPQSWHPTHALVQRRHASSQPKATPTVTKSATIEAWRREVLDAAHAQNKQVFTPAWDAYDHLRSCNALDCLPFDVLLHFAANITTHSIVTAASSDIQLEWERWGRRTQTVLHDMEHRIPDNHRRWRWQIEMARVLALRGRLDEALAMVRQVDQIPVTFKDGFFLVPMHRTLIVALRTFRGPPAVLRYVVDEWDAVRTYIDRRSVVVSDERTAFPGVSELQRYVFRSIADIQSPVGVLAEARETATRAWRQRAGELLLDALTDHKLPLEAASVLRELHNQGLHTPGHQQLLLVRALAKIGAFELANPMFATLKRTLRDPHGQLEQQQYETGLYLFSRQGDIERTQEYFKACLEGSSNDSRCIAQLIHAYAVRGDVLQAISCFNEYCFDGLDPQPNRTRANIIHYTSVIYAHAKCGDRDGMNVWLEKMALVGFKPDKTLYNIILQAFAARGEVASVGAVLDQMRASGTQPDHVSYTTVISTLAKRQDPVAAEALYKQAVEEGVQPDRLMMTALLDAHVEAGSWQGVINVFDYLLSSARTRRADMSIEVYNTLLKAYVLVGAPFDVVFRHFHRLGMMNVQPNAHTYALVIQSACDSGNMGVAEKLYCGVRELAKKWENGIRLNAYLLTILLSGFLRAGHQRKAKLTYRSMLKMNIQPTSVTFHTIIKAYANAKSEESIRVALQFIHDLMEADKKDQDWLKGTGTTGAVLDHIYGPLLSAYSKTKRPEELEQLLQELFDRGGHPTLYNLSALLDVYRRTNNLEGAMEVWPQIYQLALGASSMESLFADKRVPEGDFQQPEARRQSNLLCIPLSMYIDVMSAHGRHTEIAETWKQMKEAGFTFDAHNWNHLAVALTRAGQPVRAFEVLEHVIIPYRYAVTSLTEERDRQPQSPLLTDVELAPEVRRPPVVWPLHDSTRRATTNKLVRRRSPVDVPAHDRPADFAHQLHILHQMSPVWRSWKPHTATLAVLADVMGHLQRGNLVQVLRKNAPRRPPPATAEEAEKRYTEAQEVLAQIYEQCPLAVDHVVRFIEWRRTHKNKLPTHLR
ncbi:hypothetical protein PHLGIDRAFT_123841 [Phlebiopsis gigantea 11061_1 CR5-6]|uniref:Pentacotripeptide-repeat region of PRORP domain-containing protein n=1 Tax=Phlebiopsis gigantea (strain 11061_1 CR5-6) TaxID=745531 RepID=A0A0C3PXD0_PHLG1|nr:hypothetical protein PHLGIDRAFT_123841 [Phlebiopsis gigantea 11061_1 CR5-6]